MQTPEEIKKGLEYCNDTNLPCSSACPYYEKGYLQLHCQYMLTVDALALIRQLEAENAQLKRERDAAVNDLARCTKCYVCKNHYMNSGTCKGGPSFTGRVFSSCSKFGTGYSGLYWEWRGPCEANRGKNELPKEEEK